MRVLVVCIRHFPFLGLQEREWSHTFEYLYGSKSCALSCNSEGFAFSVGVGTHLAGEVTAAIDVVRVYKLVVGVESGFIYLEGISLVGCYRRIPGIEGVVAFPQFVPNHIDGEFVLFLLVLVFLLSAEVLRQGNVGVAENIGEGVEASIERIALVIVDFSITAAEDLTGEIARIDVYVGIAADLCEVATTVDVAIYGRGLLGGALEEKAGRADDLAHKLWMPSVVVDSIVGSSSQCSSVSTCEYRATDVSLIADNDVGGIVGIFVSIFHYRHISTAVDVLVEGSAIDVDVRLTIEASHVGEGVDGVVFV